MSLSFYLDTAEDFNGNDTFAALITAVKSGQTLVIATPNSVFKAYSPVINLGSYKGWFSYNLSKTWEQMFNSSLSNSFFLQFANYDFDGGKNIAYIDNVEISS